MSPSYEEGPQNRGRNNHLCGVFTQGVEVGEMPSAVLPRGRKSCGMDAGTFYVPTLLVTGDSGLERREAATLL